MSADEFFAAEGLVFPENFKIDGLSAISHDGRIIAGSGFYTDVFPYVAEGFLITLDAAAAATDTPARAGLTLETNYPNPFNPSTVIALTATRDQQVRLEVFDARGRLVRLLHDGALSAGRHELVWDGRDDTGQVAAAGVYLARAQGAGIVAGTHRMTLLK